jgi:hypothetical protein
MMDGCWLKVTLVTYVTHCSPITRARARARESSPYNPESELCGGAVTVSFSNKVGPRTFQMALVVDPLS